MRRALVYAISALTLLLVWYVARYGDCTAFFFHFDDFWLLHDGSAARSVADVLRPDRSGFVRPGRNGLVLYRPLSQIGYYALLHALFGFDPAPYHAVQLLAHVLNAFLVYCLAAAVLRSRALGICASMIYAAAPGHLIAVYWNALYSMTGTATWYLACLLTWVKARGDRLRIAMAFVLYVGAMLSSEHAVSLPLALGFASLLVRGDAPSKTIRQIAPFLTLSITYGVAKTLYMESWLESGFPDPIGRALVEQAYRPVLDPLSSFRLLGYYIGCTFGWLYNSSPSDPSWYAVSAVFIATLALTTWWAQSSDRGRQSVFGLLLFATALGPILVLPAHANGYYVGIAAAGFAIAIIAAARAVPRFGPVLPYALVLFALVGEVAVGEPRARANDFRFFRDFQIGALRWLRAAEETTREKTNLDEMILPRNPVTALVFEEGQAQNLLLGCDCPVRLVEDVSSETPGTAVGVVKRPLRWDRGVHYPGTNPDWDWLRGRSNPWANG